jgi:alkanesulfonate monooxygenase SsuD/methylene tetrahydromethanopterin reductase-like flavin-dependent oxidoreductase (luciferase family)
VRLGLVTPVVTLNPRIHNVWEREGTVEDVLTIAEAADRLGWHHLTASEHVAVPAEAAATRGARYWDPLATLSWIAGRTQRIRLATHVLVLGYHHPLELAKSWGTLALISGGRVTLGVGVGTLEEEFALLGKQFFGRGELADRSLVELRSAMGTSEVDGFVLDPPLPPMPIWVGGRTLRSLHRAIDLGEGWVPFGLPPAELAHLLSQVTVPPMFDLVLHPEPAWDPIDDPDTCRADVEVFRRLGATVLNLRLVHRSRTHCVEQLEAATDLVREES